MTVKTGLWTGLTPPSGCLGLRVCLAVGWRGRGLCWLVWGVDVRDRAWGEEGEKEMRVDLSSAMLFWMVKPLNAERMTVSWEGVSR